MSKIFYCIKLNCNRCKRIEILHSAPHYLQISMFGVFWCQKHNTMLFQISELATLPRKTCHLSHVKPVIFSLLVLREQDVCVYTHPSLDMYICKVEYLSGYSGNSNSYNIHSTATTVFYNKDCPGSMHIHFRPKKILNRVSFAFRSNG